jgi:tRNA A37 threonylcarbamoyladenosine dehydratase
MKNRNYFFIFILTCCSGVVCTAEGQNKKSNVGTISYMPPLFGCFAASVVIRDIIGLKNEKDA